MTAALRHYCRNPRCRSKLPQPIENAHAAFCTKGCFDQYHRRRCIVCEREMEQPNRGGQRFICGRPKCNADYRRFPALYRPFELGAMANPAPVPDGVKSVQETRENSGFVTAPSSVRGWHWVRREGEDDDWDLIGRTGKPISAVRQEGGGYWVSHPRFVPEPPIESFERAKVGAVSIAVAALPTKMLVQSVSPYGQPGHEQRHAVGGFSDWRPVGNGADMPDLPAFLRRDVLP